MNISFPLKAAVPAILALLLAAPSFAQPSSTRLAEPRIKPLNEPEWSAEQKDFLKPGVSRSNNVKTCLHNLELCRNFVPFMSYFVGPSTLSDHDKEVLILRTAWLCKGGFVWNAHVRRAKALGMTDDDMARIVTGDKASGLSSHDALLVRAVDELYANQFIGDPTWKSLSATFKVPQLLEVVFIVGQYQLLAMYQKTVGIPIDGPVTELPEAGTSIGRVVR
jgi:4-carboxymuconolactone decarboxylase